LRLPPSRGFSEIPFDVSTLIENSDISQGASFAPEYIGWAVSHHASTPDTGHDRRRGVPLFNIEQQEAYFTM
jgi:hypothetical protein